MIFHNWEKIQGRVAISDKLEMTLVERIMADIKQQVKDITKEGADDLLLLHDYLEICHPEIRGSLMNEIEDELIRRAENPGIYRRDSRHSLSWIGRWKERRVRKALKKSLRRIKEDLIIQDYDTCRNIVASEYRERENRAFNILLDGRNKIRSLRKETPKDLQFHELWDKYAVAATINSHITSEVR
jgi:hypothetical protein